LDNFTEGTDYIQFPIPRGFTKTGLTGIIPVPSGAGRSYDNRSARRFYRILQRGFQTSLANANLIDKFALSDRHTSGSDTIFVRYHLIIYFGTNSHVEFTDGDDNRKSYCRGVIKSVLIQWVDRESLIFMVRINWESVW
jgi:hypothetical protein